MWYIFFLNVTLIPDPASICEVSFTDNSDNENQNDFVPTLVKTDPLDEDLDDKYESKAAVKTELIGKTIVDLKSETGHAAPKTEVIETAAVDSKPTLIKQVKYFFFFFFFLYLFSFFS